MPIYCFACYFILSISAPFAFAEAPGEKPSPAQVDMHRLVKKEPAVLHLGSYTLKEAKGLKSATDRDTSAPRGESTGVVKLFLFMIFAIAALLLARVVVRIVRFMMLDGLKKMRLKKFNALSPMVTRSLKAAAASLWGENHLWVTNFCITEKNDRWILDDRKRTNLVNSVVEKNCLEVCLKDTNLRVKIVLLNGARANVGLECNGFSENGLMVCLEKAKGIITERRSNGKRES